jgi:hypothetical protein
MEVQQAADQLCALDVAAELEEMPTFAMAHGRIGRAFEHVQLFHDFPE